MTAEGKQACVIGAGFGGLALAIRLQAAGMQTVIVESRNKPGGCAYHWQHDGFTFDAGPTVIIDPASLEELWSLTGHAMREDVELMPVSPHCRLLWPDGTTFDHLPDEQAMRREVRKLDAFDLPGYDALRDHSAACHEDVYRKLAAEPFLNLRDMVRAVPVLMKNRAWRSLHDLVSKFVRNEKLREALSFHSLAMGGNPMTASGIYALVHKLALDGGVWWPRGGMNRLVAAMVRQFERLGGELRLGDPAIQVHTMGTRAVEVETAKGGRRPFDAVASNADVVHSYRDLLANSSRGKSEGRRLARKRFSPSAFVVHFGIEGSWPGIPHHTVLFGPRFGGLLDDIYGRGVLPADFAIYLHHPTVTDPSMAPAGNSTFYALVPVAHLGKLPIDWKHAGPLLEKRVLDEIGRRLIPDIHDRIVTKCHYTPRDFAADLNAHFGSAFSLEPVLTQSAWFRAHNRDAIIDNFYLVGAGTHPGPGIPGVLASAKITAELILEDMQ